MKRLNPALQFCRALCVIVAFVAGCGHEEPKVYRVPKETTGASPTQQMPHGHPEINTAKPELSWTLPAGWVEGGAGSMSLANFSITGQDGLRAQVSVTPLQGLAGKEIPIVNMWRHQVGLPELTEDEVKQQLQEVDIAGERGKMFEVIGNPEGTNSPMRIVTAMVHRADASWFYKLQGDADLVEAQKPAFVSFLKSVKISEASTEAAVGAVPPKAAPAAPVASSPSKIPAGWKSVPPGPMQSAKYQVTESGSGKAEVTVSVFPNSTGGTLGNVNRWRGQIALPPIGEADLAKISTPLDDKNPDMVLVDMSNPETKRQLIGAIVPRDGQWFFYKMMGDADAVAPQKEAFVAFVKSGA